MFVCILASLGLLAGEQKSMLNPTRELLDFAVYPLQQLVNAPTRALTNVRKVFTSHADLLAQNGQLREEQILLKAKLQKFSALEQENVRLRGLLDNSYKLGEQVMIAELLSVNVVPYEHIVIANKGSRFGVYPGQPVIDANGIVGQVLRVTALSSEVILITDPNHAIPVQVNRNGLRTIAQGSGKIDRLTLPYLSGNADIQPGDLLVSSGMGGVFPQGYPVATVTAPSAGDASSSKLEATPLAHLDRDREVLMVWSRQDPMPRISDPFIVPRESPKDHVRK